MQLISKVLKMWLQTEFGGGKNKERKKDGMEKTHKSYSEIEPQ